MVRLSPGKAYVMRLNDVIRLGDVLSFKVAKIRKTKSGDSKLKIECIETGFNITLSSARRKVTTIGRL